MRTGSGEASSGTKLSKRKKLLFWGALLSLVLLSTLVVGEASVRIIKMFGYSTFVFRQFDPVLGTVLIPGVEGKHQRCFDGYVKVNRYGMRDENRGLEKTAGSFRIGLFGDSFIEAVHVKPHETAAFLLEQRLNREVCGGACEVLNFSVATYSTVQELLRYEMLGDRFDLDLVVVITIPNDLVANIDPGDILAGSFYTAPHVQTDGAGLSLVDPAPPSRWMRVLANAARKSDLILYTLKFYQRTIEPAFLRGPPPSVPWSSSPIYSLNDTADARTREVWSVFGWTLRRFESEVRRDGAEFAVAYINPEDAFYWYPSTPDSVPSTVVIDWWDRQYERFQADTGAEVFDLGGATVKYIHENNIGEPYLSLSCDSHFGRRGQRVVADQLYTFLTARRLVKTRQLSVE